MVEPGAASCVEHPGRVAATACVRCGTFICDWCVKLAPSWGPGLCAKCQKVVHEAGGEAVGLSRLTRRIGAILIVRPLIGAYLVAAVFRTGLRELEQHDKEALLQVTVTLGVEFVLAVFSTVCLLAFWMRRSWARRLLQLTYGFDFINTAASVLFLGSIPAALLVLLRMALDGAVLFWATASDDAKRLLVR